MELDLHGLSVEEATGKITMALISFELDDYATELVVVTGRGTGAMQTTFLNLMDDDYPELYCKEINSGSYLVSKR